MDSLKRKYWQGYHMSVCMDTTENYLGHWVEKAIAVENEGAVLLVFAVPVPLVSHVISMVEIELERIEQ